MLKSKLNKQNNLQLLKEKKAARKTIAIIQRVKDYAIIRHAGQKDDDGQDYFAHHLAKVAEILQVITKDSDVIAAGYLHDIIEDTNTTFTELCSKFNERVALLVMEVTHEGKKDENGFYFPQLHSKEAIMIKFADRLSNISRMDSWSEERRQHYLKKSKFWKSSQGGGEKKDG